MKLVVTLLLITLSVRTPAVDGQSFNESYCPTKFQPLFDHAACAQPSPYLVAGGISSDDIKLIVDTHNEYRRSVNPPAEDMQLMAWDNELSFVAQRWANSCVLNTVKSWEQIAIPDRFAYNGQNIAWGYTIWRDAIDAMADSLDTFVYGKPFSTTYLQIVWATTSKVGCGYAVCDFAGAVNSFFVCNYAPGGNYYWNSDPASPFEPYTNGTSCGQCPSTCNDNLCDCGGKTCQNGGTLDLKTCTCACYRTFDEGDTCNRNCSAAIDDVLCQGQPGITAYTKNMCNMYINMPYLCPHLCDYCPDGTDSYNMSPMNEFDMRPKTTTGTPSNGGAGVTDAATPTMRTNTDSRLLSPGVACNADTSKAVVFANPVVSQQTVQKVVEIAAVAGWVLAAVLFCVIIVLAAVITVLCHRRQKRRQAAAAGGSAVAAAERHIATSAADEAGTSRSSVVKTDVNTLDSPPAYDAGTYKYPVDLKDEQEIYVPQKKIWY